MIGLEDHLRIPVGKKTISFLCQLLAQLLVVVYRAIVNDGKAQKGIPMG